MRLKSGKEEIVYLLDQVFAKYEATTGNQVRRNTNRKNYEDLAKLLSEISNRLPDTAAELQHDEYPPDRNKHQLSYPNLKYDITGGQIKDAGNGMVAHPRGFLVDACYIYLYGMGRKGFEHNPQDASLLLDDNALQAPVAQTQATPPSARSRVWLIAASLLAVVCLTLLYYVTTLRRQIDTINSDMKIGLYQPTYADIKNLEGTWLVYIGSPQARRSERNRYHLVVTNIVDVKYKDGYFTFKRYGANFNHVGYMQYENKNVISIHSYLATDDDTVESPRLSLLRLDPSTKFQSVISASWNFDTDNYNDVIGIREVYVKQSDSGKTKEILNTIENSTCKCKIISLEADGKQPVKFFLKNIHLDSLPDIRLKALLDEHSILLRHPDTTTLITNQASH